MARTPQIIFPLVFQTQEERDRLKDAAAFFRGSQSEVARRALEVVLEAIDASRKSNEQKWLLDRIDERVQQAFQKRE